MTDPNQQNRPEEDVPTDKDGSSGEHLSDSFQEEIEKTLERTMPVEYFTPEGILKQASQATPPPKGPPPVEVVKIPPPEVAESSIASKLPGSFPEETDENRYAIDKPLGVGASGTVFRAWDNTMQREVAIKFMNAADATNTLRLQRFVGEGRVAAQLDHPGVAPVFDMEVSESGQPYLSMRRIKGETLEAAIQKLRNGITHKAIATINDQVEVLIKLCDTIAFAHSQSVIHCDIKPANIMLGDWGEVTVIDWGTASSSDELSSGKKNLVGTPLYMAPEQALGLGADERSDVYCIGATFYYLLTFQHPCKAGTVERFWQLKRRGTIDPIPDERKGLIPQPLLAIMMKALEADPVNRYQTAAELADDLRRYQTGLSVGAYPESVGAAIRRWAKRRRKELAVATAALSLILPAGLWYMRYQDKLQSDWQLQETIDFSDVTPDELEANWNYYERPRRKGGAYEPTPFSGETIWRLEDNTLRGLPQPTAIGNISWDQNFAGSFRVDWVLVPGQDTTNLNAFIGSSTRENGYLFHIYGNKLRVVALTKETRRTSGRLETSSLPESLQPGVPYQFRMEREKGSVRLFLDGKLLIEYDDPDAFLVPKENTFGFEAHTNINATRSIREVSIYTKPAPELTSPIEIPNAYLAMGHYEEALQLYRALYERNPEGAMAGEALFRMGRCHHLYASELKAAGKPQAAASHGKSATRLYNTFLEKWPDHTKIPFVHFYLAEHELENGNIQAADTIYSKLAASYPDHDVLTTALRTYGLELMRIYGVRGNQDPSDFDEVADKCITVMTKTGRWGSAFNLPPEIDPTRGTCMKFLREKGYQVNLRQFFESEDDPYRNNHGLGHQYLATVDDMGDWTSLLRVTSGEGIWYKHKALYSLERFEELLQDEGQEPYWKAHAGIALGRPEEAIRFAKEDPLLQARILALSGRSEDALDPNKTAPMAALMALEQFDTLLNNDPETSPWLFAKLGAGQSEDLLNRLEERPKRIQQNAIWRLAVYDQALMQYIKGNRAEMNRLFAFANTYPPSFRTLGQTNSQFLMLFPHFLLQPTLTMLDGDTDGFDQACESLRTQYPHHYEKRIATLATMLLGEYGEDPDAWLETIDDPNRIAFGKDALSILAKGIRAERVGRPDLALTHYQTYLKCRATLVDGDLVSRHFAQARMDSLK